VAPVSGVDLFSRSQVGVERRPSWQPQVLAETFALSSYSYPPVPMGSPAVVTMPVTPMMLVSFGVFSIRVGNSVSDIGDVGGKIVVAMFNR